MHFLLGMQNRLSGEIRVWNKKVEGKIRGGGASAAATRSWGFGAWGAAPALALGPRLWGSPARRLRSAEASAKPPRRRRDAGGGSVGARGGAGAPLAGSAHL